MFQIDVSAQETWQSAAKKRRLNDVMDLLRFAGVLVTRQQRNEISLPSSPAVVRESLFKLVRIVSDVRPSRAHQDSSIVKRVLAEEFPAAILEFADQGPAERTILTGSKCLAPLMGLRVVEKQGQTFEMTRRAIRLDFFQVGATAPDFSLEFGAFHLYPVRGAAEGILQASNMSLPLANGEVEIMLTISHGRCCRWDCAHSA